MSIAEHQDVPAAWYPDRMNPEQLRWWDGRDWTDEVRPRIAAVPQPEPEPEPEPEVAEPVLQAPPLLQTRRGINLIAQPAQGFGHASPEQLRSWAPPRFEDRSEIPTPVSDFPSEWRRSARRAAAPTDYATQEPETYFTAETPAPVDPEPDTYFTAETTAILDPEPETYSTLETTAVRERTIEPARAVEAAPPYVEPVAIAQAAPPYVEPEPQFTPEPNWQETWQPAVPGFDSFAAEPLATAGAPSAAPAPNLTALTRRQLRALVGPLTTE